jgi:HEAT repeat protein
VVSRVLRRGIQRTWRFAEREQLAASGIGEAEQNVPRGNALANPVDIIIHSISLRIAAGVGNEAGLPERSAASPKSGIQLRQPNIEELFMNNMTKRCFVAVLALGIFAFATAVAQAKDKTEDELIAALASPKEKTVIGAMQEMEKLYPTSTKCQDAIKPLLTDSRKPVVRKAARVLGVMNAPVSEADLKNIAALLKATDKYEIIDGLKALRGLKAQSTIPEIIPLLQNADKNVVRDSIRTLAVLGDKSLIPTIKPFMEVPDLAVQKDAADAIAILKEK